MRLSFDTSEIFPAIGRALMGHGAFAGTGGYRKLSFIESLIEIARPFLIVSGIPTAGIGAVLASRVLPAPPVLLAGIIAVMLAPSGTHAFNDWVDRRRDAAIWAQRPIPAGRMPASFALVYAGILIAAALAITYHVFGTTAFTVLLIAQFLALFYCVVLRDALGYLSLPPIIAIFPIGGWAAISPETLFTSPLPWFLAGIVLTWQSAHILVYMPAHPITERGGRPRCEKKALFFYPTPRLAAVLGTIFAVFLLAEVVALGFVVSLGTIYWVLAVPITAVTLICALRLLASPSDRDRSILAFNAASMSLAFVCGGVCLDVIIRLHLSAFLNWGIKAVRDATAWVEAQAAPIDSAAYWGVLIVAGLVTLASAGKVIKDLASKKPADDVSR